MGGRPRETHRATFRKVGRSLDPATHRYVGTLGFTCDHDSDRAHEVFMDVRSLRDLADMAGRYAFQIDPSRPLIQAAGERVVGEGLGFDHRALDGFDSGMRRLLAHQLALIIGTQTDMPLRELHALAALRDALMVSLGLRRSE